MPRMKKVFKRQSVKFRRKMRKSQYPGRYRLTFWFSFAIAGGMLHKLFQKKVEDFSCGHCFLYVRGNGYTNHCPKCLWSRHVDIHPGDRRSKCRGLMEPVSGFLEGGEWKILHRCLICGHEKKNRLAEGDNFRSLEGLFGGK